MPSKKFRTEFPAHALTEMKSDAKQRKFWHAWAAVGDAKLDAADAARAVIDVERSWAECRASRSARQTDENQLCACGRHRELYDTARAEFDNQRDHVATAIAAFKES